MTGKIHNPRGNAGLLSRCSFAWFVPTVIKSFNQHLTEDDLFETSDDHKSDRLGDLLENAWEKEKCNKNPLLWRAIWKSFKLNFIQYAILLTVTELVLKTSQCISFVTLLKYFSHGNKTISKKDAFVCAIILITCSLGIVIGQHQSMYNYRLLGMKVRVACCSLIYRKSLRISKDSMGATNVGNVVNLVTNDVNRFDYIAPLINNLWLCPVQVTIVTMLLYYTNGWSGIVGIGIFILIIPIQIFIGNRLATLRRKISKITDERIEMLSEVISNIQVIKMLTWEKPFSLLIKQIRSVEIKQLRRSALLLATLMSFMNFLPKLTLFASILVHIYFGNILTPSYVFGLVAFYNMLKLPLNKFFPQALFRWGEAIVAMKRITDFLLINEIEESENSFGSCNNPDTAIFLKNVSAKSDTLLLKNINLNVNKNGFVAIVGNIGSGKTTLLNAILKEIPTNASVFMKGIVSHSSQKPWIFKGTLKENVLFDEPYNETRYKTVIKVCALEKDLSLLKHGDNTLLTENGSNLSGGQKSRINLARAVYKLADIYLLDDPFSSIDAIVTGFIFNECLNKFLKDKCVVLTTNQLRYLGNSDKICILEDGAIVADGTLNEIKNNQYILSRFSSYENLNSSPQEMINTNLFGDDDHFIRNKDKDIEESQAIGNVDFKVYKNYLLSGGNLYVHLLLLFIAILFVASCVLFDVGIGYWSDIDESLVNGNLMINLSRQAYLIILSIIMIVIIITSIVSGTTYYMLFIRCARNLHDTVLDKIFTASLNFFHATPSGRIINRFSKDLGMIDDYLHTVAIDTILMTLAVIGVFILKTTINYWLCIAMLMLIVIFFSTRKLFLPAMVSIKRLEGITKSPIYTHIKSTIDGLITIRAFRKENHYKAIFDSLQDIHTSSWFMYLSSVFTYRFLIDIMAVVLIAFVTFSFFFVEDPHAGIAGLAISQCMMLMSMIQWCVRQSCEITVTMTSVERITEYLSIQEEERSCYLNNFIVKKSWCCEGRIIFSDVKLWYDRSKNPILKSLNFEIKPKQKVGIVGRTGAGKSSICSAILQLAHTEGLITIDGINIKEIPLCKLRSKISIIPQESVVFSATLRANLDPGEEFNDIDLWNVLEEVKLKEFVRNLPDGLSTKMSLNSYQLSVGQKQLISLARVMLRRNRIIIMDEATANMDFETESLVQDIVKNKFSKCTVLIIAHKLRTIMNCDLVLVIDDGMVKEYGCPIDLLERKGNFYRMVKKIDGNLISKQNKT